MNFSIPDLTAAPRSQPNAGLCADLDLLGSSSPVLRSRFRCSRFILGCRLLRPGSNRRVGDPGWYLLKIGTYGFLRFGLPMLPDATVECMPWILGLSVAGIIYGALVALAQSDIKQLDCLFQRRATRDFACWEFSLSIALACRADCCR